MAGSNGNGDGMTVPQRMLKLLSDGKYHTEAELRTCLWDEMAVSSAVSFHLDGIRKMLRARGEDVVRHKRDGISWYMHVRIVSINS